MCGRMASNNSQTIGLHRVRGPWVIDGERNPTRQEQVFRPMGQHTRANRIQKRMGIWTVSMSTITKPLSNEGFRLCVCGSEFKIIDHFRKRRPKERVGTAAVCTNKKC